MGAALDMSVAAPLERDEPKAEAGDFSYLPPLVAYCDGSGTTADRPCGAGVVLYDGEDVIVEASRALGNGTNNHAEVTAVRAALAITDAPGLRERPLIVRTDSQYTITALTVDWEPDPWRPNARVIELTRALMRGRAVRFEHVKGHSGVPGNERADELAGLARKRQIPAGPAPAPAPPVAPSAAVVMTVEDAASLRGKLHAARAKLVQRNMAGSKCDPRDAKRVEELEALWNDLPAGLRGDAQCAFRESHPCADLANCPMGRAR
jgi:ribonuclease HI